jgi:hypothetical protein
MRITVWALFAQSCHRKQADAFWIHFPNGMPDWNFRQATARGVILLYCAYLKEKLARSIDLVSICLMTTSAL